MKFISRFIGNMNKIFVIGLLFLGIGFWLLAGWTLGYIITDRFRVLYIILAIFFVAIGFGIIYIASKLDKDEKRI